MSADEVDAIVAADTASNHHVSDDSAVNDANLSSHSLCHHGWALFVDNKALEASGEESEEGSAEESAAVGAASESIDAQ